jgi:hypothetical protein
LGGHSTGGCDRQGDLKDYIFGFHRFGVYFITHTLIMEFGAVLAYRSKAKRSITGFMLTGF